MKSVDKLMVFLALMSLFSGSAYSDFWSGNNLKSELTDLEASRGGGIGLGYVMGVYDSLVMGELCAPAEATAGQMATVVLKWMRNNPDKLHFNADSIVRTALQNSWPCKAPSTAPKKPKNVPAQPQSKSTDKSPF